MYDKIKINIINIINERINNNTSSNIRFCNWSFI